MAGDRRERERGEVFEPQVGQLWRWEAMQVSF
jgi:hypothetical protein